MATTLLAWAPQDQPSLGAIEVAKSERLTPPAYWNHLGFRLKALAKSAAPEELAQASEAMMQAGLLDAPIEPEQAGTMLLWENPAVQARLQAMGVPGPMPMMPILRSDPQALAALETVTLADWATELAAALTERG
jgi:hypothetical protein